MAWKYYRLVFRPLSPLHIGYRKVGNLMETRHYVPGKVLWGALTARLTRDMGQGAAGQAYQQVGEEVRKHFRFGYLWPSLDAQRPYLPWEHDDFEFLLLGSYASTALDYSRGSAEEGSLHETEFIAPVARDGRPVYLVGDLWVQEDSLPPELQGWKKALGRVQLGGERAYGWGRVQLKSDLSKPDGTSSNCTIANHKWKEKGGEIIIHLPENARTYAHAVAIDGLENIAGPIEPLVGWEMTPSGAFQLSQQPLICWKPGALVKASISVRVDPWGIWRKI